MDNNLLPCPFCGEPVLMQEAHERKSYYRGQCDNDDCAYNRWFNTKEEAIEAWNKRVPVSQEVG